LDFIMFFGFFKCSHDLIMYSGHFLGELIGSINSAWFSIPFQGW
jgi:hypothetical protein